MYKESMLYLIVKSSLFQINGTLPFFIYTSLTEVFITYLRLSILVGIYLMLLPLLLHIWLFINPGLYRSEYVATQRMIFMFTLLWTSNSLFIYQFLLPRVWNFFSQFEVGTSTSPLSIFFEIKLTEYVEFLVNIIICSTLSLQVFITVLLWILYYSQYDLPSFKKNRRRTYIIIIVFATMITPPDVLTQVILSVSLVITYEFLILSVLMKNECKFQMNDLNSK